MFYNNLIFDPKLGDAPRLLKEYFPPQNGTMLQEFYNSDCDDLSRTYEWAWNEKVEKLTYVYGDRGENYEILELNQTTLKLKYLDSYGIFHKQFEDKPTHIIYKRVK